MNDNALKLAGLEVCRMENHRYASFESADIFVPAAVDAAIKTQIVRYERRKKSRYRLLNIACIAVAIIIIGSVILTINVEARNRLARMVRTMIGATIEYAPNVENLNNETIGEITELKVNWIPDGMELQRTFQDKRGITYYYKGDDVSVFIMCSLIGENTSVMFFDYNNEDIKYEIGDYNGMYYEFIYADEYSKQNNLFLINEADNYFIAIDSPLEKVILFKIYDNLDIAIKK